MLTVVICIAVAFICFKIGIYTVLLWAFSIALKLSLALIIALTGVLTWRWWKGRNQWRKL